MRRILINAQRPEAIRVAVVDDERLEEYHVEVAEGGLLRGNIYRGIVRDTEPAFDAAFVDFGGTRDGFLPGRDVVPEAQHGKKGNKSGKGRPKIHQLLDRRKPVLVQVVRDAVGNKGALLTTDISFAGRFLVFKPFDGVKGVSRKISSDKERARLKKALDAMNLPKGAGVVARTVAAGRTLKDLRRDLNLLLRLWKRVRREHSRGAKRPRRLYVDRDPVVRAVRDHAGRDVDTIVIDDPDAYEKAKALAKTLMPRSGPKLELYEGAVPIMAQHGVEEQIAAIYDRQVGLPSGGSIVVDPTEALISIDVNAGRGKKGSQEKTALATNLEAAPEVARQLRLRQLGGLIVVDFIDMREAKHRKRVEKAVKDAFKSDRARVSVGRISGNGLLEINRQKIAQALALRTFEPCEACGGTGRVPTAGHLGLGLVRRLEARAASGDFGHVEVALHPSMMAAVQNERRQDLAAIERRYGLRIAIVGDPSLERSEERLQWHERKDDDEDGGGGGESDAVTAADVALGS